MTRKDFERLLALRKVAETCRHGTVNKYDVVRIKACENGHRFAIGSHVTIFRQNPVKYGKKLSYLAVDVDPDTVKRVEAAGLTYDWGRHADYLAYYITEDEFEVVYNGEVEE